MHVLHDHFIFTQLDTSKKCEPEQIYKNFGLSFASLDISLEAKTKKQRSEHP